MRAQISDPPGPNFYRYFVNTNSNGMRRDAFSVLEDPFFDGRQVTFPLNRPANDGEEFDLATFGLFNRADSVTLKWVNFGRREFDFWNTLEFSAANQGPFSSGTIVSSNINGGLGVWCAQSASYYELVVPPN
ncbi:MAG: hypothetical protein HC821_05965 [Lewinella sp.]|nr:hypothetical protein [Lewinella sp.]